MVMSQMKDQDKIPGKQLNEVQIGSLPEKTEFRIMIVKMIQDLGKRKEMMQEMFTKAQTEMNNTPEGINSRIADVEGQMSDLEDRMMEITASRWNMEKKNGKKKKKKKIRRQQLERPLGQN